jgi:hypothetical protein
MKRMTFLFSLLFSCLLLTTAPADAQTPPPKRTSAPAVQPKADPAVTPSEKLPLLGKLPGDKKPVAPKEPTAEQLAEANAIFKDCSNSENQSHYLDCECLSLTFLQLRIKDVEEHGKPTGQFLLMEEARKSCVNTTGLAGKTYNECRTWAVGARPDAEEFCSCYANTYAKTYAGAPTSNIKINERMMITSLQACGSSKASQLRVEQERAMLKMQEDGSYQKLFPGAEGVFYPKPKRPPSSAAKPKTPAQILSDHLNQSYTGQ